MAPAAEMVHRRARWGLRRSGRSDHCASESAADVQGGGRVTEARALDLCGRELHTRAVTQRVVGHARGA